MMQLRNYRLKILQPRFQILYNLPCQHIRIRKIIQIGQWLIFQPGDVQRSFITVDDFFVSEFAPAALGINFIITDDAGEEQANHSIVFYSWRQEIGMISVEKYVKIFNLLVHLRWDAADQIIIVARPRLTKAHKAVVINFVWLASIELSYFKESN